jgi:hypothetical protein
MVRQKKSHTYIVHNIKKLVLQIKQQQHHHSSFFTKNFFLALQINIRYLPELLDFIIIEKKKKKNMLLTNNNYYFI